MQKNEINKTIMIAFLSFIGLGLFDGFFGVAWPSIRETFGVANESLGVLTFVGTMGGVVAAAAVGQLITRRGFAFVLISSMVLMGGGMFAVIGAPIWSIFIAANGIRSAGMGLLDGGMNTFGAMVFRPRILNWLHASFGIGTTLGALLMTGMLSWGQGWQFAGLLMAVLMCVLLLLFVVTRKRWVYIHALAQETKGNLADDLPYQNGRLLQPAVIGSILTFLLYSGLEMGIGTWAFTLLSEGRGVDVATAGTATTLYWGAFTVGRILLGFIEQNQTRLVRISMIVSLGGTILLWSNLSPALNLVSLIVTGIALAPIFPALISQTPQRLGNELAGRVVGYQIAAAGLGVALVPAVAGWLSDRYSLEVIAVLLVVVAVSQWGVNEWVNRINLASFEY